MHRFTYTWVVFVRFSCACLRYELQFFLFLFLFLSFSLNLKSFACSFVDRSILLIYLTHSKPNDLLQHYSRSLFNHNFFFLLTFFVSVLWQNREYDFLSNVVKFDFFSFSFFLFQFEIIANRWTNNYIHWAIEVILKSLWMKNDKWRINRDRWSVDKRCLHSKRFTCLTFLRLISFATFRFGFGWINTIEKTIELMAVPFSLAICVATL